MEDEEEGRVTGMPGGAGLEVGLDPVDEQGDHVGATRGGRAQRFPRQILRPQELVEYRRWVHRTGSGELIAEFARGDAGRQLLRSVFHTCMGYLGQG